MLHGLFLKTLLPKQIITTENQIIQRILFEKKQVTEYVLIVSENSMTQKLFSEATMLNSKIIIKKISDIPNPHLHHRV